MMSIKRSIAARNLLAIGFVLATVDMAHAQAAPEAAASADNADTGGLADIVVTATRRATNVQDVPFAISAVGGDTLRDRGIVDPRQLSSLAPNLNVDQGIGNGATHVSIRGLASTDFSLGASSPVAIYLDDIYQPFQYGLGTQIFDLNRIEVLRGPQGTLFGKNTTSGALNYYSQTPTDRDEGYFNVDGGGGDYTHFATEGAFNKPITDQLAARFSFRVDRRNDYIDNLFDGNELGHYTNYNARLQLAWKPSSDTTVNLKVFGLQNRGDGPVYISQYAANPCTIPLGPLDPPFPVYFKCDGNNTPAPDSPDSRHTNSEVPSFENYHNYGAVLKVDQAFGDYNLTSITGAQKGGYSVATNDDGTAGDFFHSRQRSKTQQVSQELRLATPANEPLRAVIGLFGQYDKIRAGQGSGSTTVDPAFEYIFTSLAEQRTTTLAAFGSVTYDITDRFSVIGGLRYSYERKKIESLFAAYNGRDFIEEDIYYTVLTGKYDADDAFGDVEQVDRQRHSWKRLTWDLTANFKPTDDSLLFAKVATGFRSGGFPVGITSPSTFVRLNPETVTSYEVGFKSEWFDRKLRVNGSAYYLRYKDMQVQTPVVLGAGLILSNAGQSRVQGAELEVELAPAKGLVLSGGLGFNDAKYRRYNSPAGDLAGNVLPYASRWSGNVGANYELPVGEDHSLILGTNWTYRTRIHFDPYQDAMTSDKARFIGNARIGFGNTGKGWRLSAYVNNLTNLDMKAFAYLNGPITPTIYAPKRTWGLQGAFRF